MKIATFFQMVMVLFLCMVLAVPPGLIAQDTQEATTEEEGPAFRPEEINQLMAPVALILMTFWHRSSWHRLTPSRLFRRRGL